MTVPGPASPSIPACLFPVPHGETLSAPIPPVENGSTVTLSDERQQSELHALSGRLDPKLAASAQAPLSLGGGSDEIVSRTVTIPSKDQSLISKGGGPSLEIHRADTPGCVVAANKAGSSVECSTLPKAASASPLNEGGGQILSASKYGEEPPGYVECEDDGLDTPRGWSDADIDSDTGHDFESREEFEGCGRCVVCLGPENTPDGLASACRSGGGAR